MITRITDLKKVFFIYFSFVIQVQEMSFSIRSQYVIFFGETVL